MGGVRRVIELRAGDARASVDVERGGRLASFVVGGRELLLGAPNDDDRSIRWGCFLMAPWPGRLADARLAWRDGIQLTRTHGRHAIHGLVLGRPWRVLRAGPTSVRLECDLPRNEWPMGGVVRETIHIAPHKLTLEATIEAGEAMPAALGWHPWFLRSGEPSVRLAADGVLVTRGMIPTGEIAEATGKLDLRAGPALGDRRLDHAFVGVRSPVEIAWPDLRLRMAFTPAMSTVVVYTPPGSFCVEPQSAWPNALGGPRPRAGAETMGAHELGPGERLDTVVELAWS